ncbi:MAG: diaminopimelate epimerase [Gammaproteobacteria bacterium]|nr:diaminopimelate epimerase [Gammaproteobacteria bacterium]NIR98680.1 diaminopimelate epimerase [Gammaproteobacteria bacterium]NIT64392.1 diaminopimelate epimerase [Gammaproteobacteria bacterium]NIV19491.1 diaminopimelate epimerase [Gammaproteobacteria bacterium]NIY32972.1 diaminopimelate epimerase [Gammaproteobacteria bacterium]
MQIAFTKMHGLGNDFVVIDGVSQRVRLDAERVRRLADRRRGVGCDQVLLVEPAQGPGVDFRYRIFNADGGEVAQCGNGARCLARFAREKGLSDEEHIRVETLAGPMELRLEPGGEVRVDMGVPRLEPAEIPFDAPERRERYDLDVDGTVYSIGAVSLGNPHVVLRVDDADRAPVAELGPRIEGHRRFPERVNVGFMQVIDGGHIRLRVFERGAGETMACGSGACAAVVVGRVQGLLNRRVAVDLPGGRLVVSWAGPGEAALLTGPATKVFEGTIEL